MKRRGWGEGSAETGPAGSSCPSSKQHQGCWAENAFKILSLPPGVGTWGWTRGLRLLPAKEFHDLAPLAILASSRDTLQCLHWPENCGPSICWQVLEHLECCIGCEQGNMAKAGSPCPKGTVRVREINSYIANLGSIYEKLGTDSSWN